MLRFRIFQLQTFAVVAFAFAVSYNSLEYVSIKEANASCFPKDTCSVPRDIDSLEKHNCDCGSLCGMYRTCCIDSQFLNHSRSIYRRSSCTTVGQGSTSVLMVDHCKQKYRGPPEIRLKCEDDVIDWSDPFASAPVTNVKTQTTYKSLFCAICNLEKPQSLAMWEVMLECSSLGEYMNVCTENRDFVLSNIMYLKDKESWGLWSWDKKSDWKFRFLPVVYKLPKTLKSAVKECRPGLIYKCSPDWKNSIIERHCLSYMAAVYFPHGAFRNIHCAICNHVKNFAEMSCHPIYSSPFKSPPALSFGLLLDIDLKDGDKVGVISQCQKGEVYDPFAKKCRLIECPIPGYKLKDSQCVQE